MKSVLFSILVVALGGLRNGVPLEPPQSYGLGQFFESRIVGGDKASDNYAPHMVALVFGEWITSLVCGGSIISPRHVLTAAHCIDAVLSWGGELLPSLYGVIGSNEWASTLKTTKFSHYKNHPKWDRWEINFDAGVLYVEGELSLSERVSPVSLSFHWVNGGHESYVTGWGRLGKIGGSLLTSLNRLGQFFVSRIVGGDKAPDNYAPHMVALVFGEWITSLVCGGSIISTRHVLTAAHCIDAVVIWEELSPSLYGVIGSNEWASTQKTTRFSQYKNHPEWDWRHIKSDIGVLYVERELSLSERVSPVPLSFQWVEGGHESYVTGWGRLGAWDNIPDKLQMLYLETLSPKQCEQAIHEASLMWGAAPPVVPEIEICTFHSPGRGMCNGDSGSALVSRSTGEQIGLVSWGFPCARGAPDVFVRVAGFQDFLLEIIGEQGNA